MSEVAPTRMNLGVFKGKQIAAKKGYDLLKSKADALKVRFRDICKVIYDTKAGMAESSSTSFFSLAQAEYAAGNFRSKVLENNLTASVRVASRTDNVAGVKLPVFNQYDTGAEISENLGLVGGGRKIQACRDRFGDYLKALIKLASLQTSFIAMDEALKVTNRRVNALENVTLPKIISTIAYINRELDELEREDFTRLKMVKKKKEQAIKAEEKLKAEKLKELENENAGNANKPSPAAPKASAAPAAAPKAAPAPAPKTVEVVDDVSSEAPTASPTGKKGKKDKKKGGAQSAPAPAATTIEGLDGEDEDLIFK